MNIFSIIDEKSQRVPHIFVSGFFITFFIEFQNKLIFYKAINIGWPFDNYVHKKESLIACECVCTYTHQFIMLFNQYGSQGSTRNLSLSAYNERLKVMLSVYGWNGN